MRWDSLIDSFALFSHHVSFKNTFTAHENNCLYTHAHLVIKCRQRKESDNWADQTMTDKRESGPRCFPAVVVHTLIRHISFNLIFILAFIVPPRKVTAHLDCRKTNKKNNSFTHKDKVFLSVPAVICSEFTAKFGRAFFCWVTGNSKWWLFLLTHLQWCWQHPYISRYMSGNSKEFSLNAYYRKCTQMCVYGW